jgi:hypothetical protein
MTADTKQEGPVLRPGGIHRLLEDGGEDLTDDQRALLLALVTVDAESGRSLEEEERAALDELRAQVQDYDVDQLAQAVEHMVKAKPRKAQKLKWPSFKRERGRS